MAIQEDLRSIALDDPSGLGDATLGEMPRMRVRKRDGSLDAIDLNKIVARVERCADGLDAVDPMRVALRTISGLVDGSTTEELDHLAVRTEDHPLEYGSFSGVIPKGEYGAGTVDIWDSGSYDTEKFIDTDERGEVIVLLGDADDQSARTAAESADRSPSRLPSAPPRA